MSWESDITELNYFQFSPWIDTLSHGWWNLKLYQGFHNVSFVFAETRRVPKSLLYIFPLGFWTQTHEQIWNLGAIQEACQRPHHHQPIFPTQNLLWAWNKPWITMKFRNVDLLRMKMARSRGPRALVVVTVIVVNRAGIVAVEVVELQRISIEPTTISRLVCQ